MRPVEETNDENLETLAWSYAKLGRTRFNDPEQISAYYAFIAGFNAARTLDRFSADSAPTDSIDEVEALMRLISERSGA
jgi:hypothetical protein